MPISAGHVKGLPVALLDRFQAQGSSDPAQNRFYAIAWLGVETNTCARRERVHQVDNLFEQQQLGRVCPQSGSNQYAVEFSRRKGAPNPVLGGWPRCEQTTFDAIATLS